MKRHLLPLLAAVLLMCLFTCAASADERRIAPRYNVPQEVQWLLEVAAGEVGYREGDHGYTKYGEWAGDPYAQWCAEFLCWCVDQVDQQHGTELLGHTFPNYSGQNTGRNWFIRNGRYIVRWGNLEGWGYQWLKGEDSFLTTGSYIPQPGDYVFFTWTSDLNTDHVALVEYCTVDDEGQVTVHVIEGNTPVSVKRTEYPLTYKRILGFGTVHDAADWTMRMGNSGEKVRQLQRKLVYLELLTEEQVDGVYGQSTSDAVKAYQHTAGLKENGIANIRTQRAMNRTVSDVINSNPATWLIADDEDDDFSLSGLGELTPWEQEPEEEDIPLPIGVADEDEDEVEVDLDDENPDWY